MESGIKKFICGVLLADGMFVIGNVYGNAGGNVLRYSVAVYDRADGVLPLSFDVPFEKIAFKIF